jgi:mRNA interferase MazF
MRRGEIWSVSGGPDYAGKPRPAIIIQDDTLGETRSITLCALTSNDADSGVLRPVLIPSAENGLRTRSFAMVDKVTTVPKTKLGMRIGKISAADIRRVDRGLLVFLGLTNSTSGDA